MGEWPIRLRDLQPPRRAHSEAIDNAAAAFRELIDLGIRHGGSYYLTYHRWARKDQIERCYPQIREFLALKRQYDPEELFQSTWYRHYRMMFVARDATRAALAGGAAPAGFYRGSFAEGAILAEQRVRPP